VRIHDKVRNFQSLVMSHFSCRNCDKVLSPSADVCFLRQGASARQDKQMKTFSFSCRIFLSQPIVFGLTLSFAVFLVTISIVLVKIRIGYRFAWKIVLKQIMKSMPNTRSFLQWVNFGKNGKAVSNGISNLANFTKFLGIHSSRKLVQQEINSVGRSMKSSLKINYRE